jgi:hypothetical protein
MSPVSKGRKRKPNKSGRRTAREHRPGWRPETSAGHGFDPTSYLGDLSPLVSKAEVERTMDRRVFTMPHYGTTIGDQDFDRLNPADPDERGLLIQGEHPEFHAYVDDPSWDGEIDGINPRFHLTMHEVIANQLWDNDPPEVWQAAERLREHGMDRHDILHKLAAVMAEHMHPTLVSGEQFDTDAYRRALGGLGRRATTRAEPTHST